MAGRFDPGPSITCTPPLPRPPKRGMAISRHQPGELWNWLKQRTQSPRAPAFGCACSRSNGRGQEKASFGVQEAHGGKEGSSEGATKGSGGTLALGDLRARGALGILKNRFARLRGGGGGSSPLNLGCTVRTRSTVNVGRAGAKSAVNTTEVSVKCRDCQKWDSRRFGTFLT